MLKKNKRLVERNEFEEIREKGHVYSSPLFGLAVLIKDDKKKKVGMIVSKKISKRAVDRNRIRRLLAEGIGRNWELIPEGVRMVFLAKQLIKGKKMTEVEGEIIKTITNF